MGTPLRLGLSPCPNDTFAFHALMEREVGWRGLELEFEIQDVEELNRRLLEGTLQATKASFHAALALGDAVRILPAGSALGFGVGPVLLGSAREEAAPRAIGLRRVLGPGRWTTAALLWRLFHAGEEELRHVLFSEIPPALERGQAELGVCIHESRFTWRERGLRWVEDLGLRWERETGLALPLGGIAARASLGHEVLDALSGAVRDSIQWARAHPERCLASMRRHAAEMDEAVLWKHVELYVNELTLDLGRDGRRALAELARRAREAGLAGFEKGSEGGADGGAEDGALRVHLPGARGERLHHVVPAADWAAFLRSGEAEWRPPSLASEGFVHLSTSGQLAGTLATHYAGADEIALLEVAPPDGVRFEAPRNGSRGAGLLFPHLHRGLRAEEVVSVTWLGAPLREGTRGR